MKNFIKNFFSTSSPQLFDEDAGLREQAFSQLVQRFQGEFKRKVRAKYRQICMALQANFDEQNVAVFCNDSLLEYWTQLQKAAKRADLSQKPPEGWLVNTANNKILEHVRKEKRSKTDVYQSEKHDNTHTDEGDIWGIADILSDEDKRAIYLEVMQLFEANSKGNCMAIFEGIMEGLLQREIAEELNTSENTVKTQFARCKEKAKKWLAEKGVHF